MYGDSLFCKCCVWFREINIQGSVPSTLQKGPNGKCSVGSGGPLGTRGGASLNRLCAVIRTDQRRV